MFCAAKCPTFSSNHGQITGKDCKNSLFLTQELQMLGLSETKTFTMGCQPLAKEKRSHMQMIDNVS